jgi:hypothetical protein
MAACLQCSTAWVECSWSFDWQHTQWTIASCLPVLIHDFPAERQGNEARFINDYRGVRGKPNCKYVTEDPPSILAALPFLPLCVLVGCSSHHHRPLCMCTHTHRFELYSDSSCQGAVRMGVWTLGGCLTSARHEHSYICSREGDQTKTCLRLCVWCILLAPHNMGASVCRACAQGGGAASELWQVLVEGKDVWHTRGRGGVAAAGGS